MKIMMRLDKSGQAMVEMAFVIFVLVILIFAITEFGRAMYTKNSLTNAARGVARTAVVNSGLQESNTTGITCPGGTLTLSASSNPPAINLCSQYLIGQNGADITAQVQIFDPAGTEKTSGPAASGDTVKVTITRTNSVTVVPRLFGPNGFIPFFPSSLAGTASMRQEQ
jgi:Flp pilus assembly protein TadG